jgi:hypothetical protein
MVDRGRYKDETVFMYNPMYTHSQDDSSCIMQKSLQIMVIPYMFEL